jgi:molybdate-binding protein
VPVIRERVDLLVNRRSYFEPPLQTLFAFCRTDAFAAHAQALGGYDHVEHGKVIWNAP